MKGVLNLFKYQNNAQMREKNPEEELKEAFRVFDAEGTGVIGEQRNMVVFEDCGGCEDGGCEDDS